MAVSDDKLYEELKTHLRYLNEKMIQAFEMYIKVATAIVGGSFFLHMKLPANDSQRKLMSDGANALMILVGVGMTIIIINNLLSWHSYRKTLSDNFSEIHFKRSPGTWLVEILMCILILTTSFGFFAFNPLYTK